MRPLPDIKANARLEIKEESKDGFFAYLLRPYRSGQVTVVASWGLGWEHVSMAMKNRTPTWEEMCALKEIFWGDEELVVQYHPPKSEHVNLHPYCLHLWKKADGEFDAPPKKLVG